MSALLTIPHEVAVRPACGKEFDQNTSAKGEFFCNLLEEQHVTNIKQ